MRERDPMGMDRPGVVAASTRATVSGCGSAGSWPTAGSGWLDVWDMIGPDVAWRARHACAACGPAAADRGRFQDLTIGPTVMVGAAPTVGRMGELVARGPDGPRHARPRVTFPELGMMVEREPRIRAQRSCKPVRTSGYCHFLRATTPAFCVAAVLSCPGLSQSIWSMSHLSWPNPLPFPFPMSQLIWSATGLRLLQPLALSQLIWSKACVVSFDLARLADSLSPAVPHLPDVTCPILSVLRI